MEKTYGKICRVNSAPVSGSLHVYLKVNNKSDIKFWWKNLQWKCSLTRFLALELSKQDKVCTSLDTETWYDFFDIKAVCDKIICQQNKLSCIADRFFQVHFVISYKYLSRMETNLTLFTISGISCTKFGGWMICSYGHQKHEDFWVWGRRSSGGIQRLIVNKINYFQFERKHTDSPNIMERYEATQSYDHILEGMARDKEFCQKLWTQYTKSSRYFWFVTHLFANDLMVHTVLSYEWIAGKKWVVGCSCDLQWVLVTQTILKHYRLLKW